MGRGAVALASHPDPDVRRRVFERRADIICTAASRVAGEEITRKDFILYLANEPDPQEEMDRLHARALLILAGKLEVP